MKKSILTILATLAVTFALGACEAQTTEPPQTPDNGVETPAPDDGNTGNNDGTQTPDDGEQNDGNQGSDGGNTGNQEPVDLVGELLKNAYALKSGETLAGTHTLTGVVSNVEKTGQQDICLTFKVVGYEQYAMYCYWLQDADFIKVGDTITVSGTIKNYNGIIEFDHPTLDSYVAADGNQGSGDAGNGGSTEHLYNGFTATEEALLVQYLGEVIPFIPNSEYYLESYYGDGDYSEGFYFYTVGNTQAEFNAYLKAFSAYTSSGTEVDEYGDTWYYFDKGDLYVDLAYSQYGGEYYVDVYAYIWTEDDNGNSGDVETPEQGGNGEQGGTESDVDIITNHGKGLPTEADGVYNVDFTKASNVKDVTDQGYYLDGCPTVGKAGVLVVPVEFSDITAESKGYTVDKIKTAWTGASGTDYYSVHDYYYTSSYGKLDLQITVLDTWFRPKNNSSYYKNSTDSSSGEENGDQLIIDEVLSSLEGTMDLTKFDSDGNSVIDSIILIPTVDINADVIFNWAYRYWNQYTDSDGYYYEYDGVSANDYLWAPYQFLLEEYDANGDVAYNKNNCNTYTFIHEFGHVLGADDYYDTSYSGGAPMDGCDVMDSMSGDHNAYTKFNYGWLTSSRLVVTTSTITLTLEDFSKNGDSIILANNWDETLGAYQEYYVLTYYKNSGLNGGEAGYFNGEGVVVHHVNASLYKEVYEGKTYYDVYNNNTDASDEYGTTDNLIELVKSSANKYVFGVGDSLPTVKDDNGTALGYTFTVDAITANSVTITFTKK